MRAIDRRAPSPSRISSPLVRRFAKLAPAMLLACSIQAANAAAPSEAFLLASEAVRERAATAPRSVASSPVSARSAAPVVTVIKTGPGQAGYVHYFVITRPDGELETQIGIELADERIAWSFPEIGVVISRFIGTGSVIVNGNAYEVEHLYGIRPFPDEASMRALQRELPARVAHWVEQKTPYCEQDDAWSARCVSCLGFVLRVLYPGPSPLQPALPADFRTARASTVTTDDLLLYLAGVAIDASRDTRRKRIEALAVPETLREQLVRLALEQTAPTRAGSEAGAGRPAIAKTAPGGRSVVQLPKRVLPRRRS